MKPRGKGQQSNLKRPQSRRRLSKKVKRCFRLVNKISKRTQKKSKKRKSTTIQKKMDYKKPIAIAVKNEESTIKLVKKLLGHESVDALPESNEEANLLQDLDLLVLGSSPEEYNRYRELLRKEYSHLDDNCYKQMRLKLINGAPSTSGQAVASNADIESLSTIQSSASRRQKKPFIKFKDNKYSTAQKKTNLLQRAFRNPAHLPTLHTPSPSQIVSRKILRTIRKRVTTVKHQSTDQNQTKSILNGNFIEGLCNPNVKKILMDSTETKVKNADVDDDCVCIDPQPEIILIDDESIAVNNILKHGDGNSQQLKQYEPIGSIRTNQFKMSTSTPELKLLSGNSSLGIPFYGDTIPMRDTLTSDSLFSELKDYTHMEKRNVDCEVIVIDDSVALGNNTAKKRTRKRPKADDSVIFVSEKKPDNFQSTSTAPAYISLYTPVEESHFRPTNSSTPKPKRPRNELFSSKEEKQLRQYNENAYNPHRDEPIVLTKKRMVIVDGSNVAYQHALNKEFSVEGLKICLEYFEKMGHEVKAVVPQFRLQRQKSSDPNELQKLHKEGKIVFTPCKNLPGKSSTSYDDRFVLQLAVELDAAVVSNDNYRDLINENPAFKKIIENRVIGYTWCNDLFILPKDPYGKWGPTLNTILNRS